jgi:hypothetical protein
MSPGGWFAVSLLLWIIGLPLYLSKRGELQRLNAPVTSDERKCPQCAESIKADAVRCRFCGVAVEPVAAVHEKVSNHKTGRPVATAILVIIVLFLGLGFLSQLTDSGSISDRSGALSLP